MQLVADRFVVLDGEGGRACRSRDRRDGRVGRRQRRRRVRPMRWTDRCERLPRAASSRDRAARRFRPARRGVAVRSVVVRAGVDRRRAGLGVDARSRETVSERRRPVGRRAGARLRPRRRTTGRRGVLPEAGTGYPQEPDDDAADDAAASARASASSSAGPSAALAEMFHDGGGCRPHVAALWGPPGSGKRIVGAGARANRAHARVRAGRVAAGRRRGMRSCGAAAACSSSATRPTAIAGRRFSTWPCATRSRTSLLMVGNDECRSIDGVRLERVPADALVSAIRPRPLSPVSSGRRGGRPSARRACRGDSSGCSGRSRSPASRRQRRSTRRGLSRVAEQPAVYGREDDDRRPARGAGARRARGPPRESWPRFAGGATPPSCTWRRAGTRRACVSCVRRLAASRGAAIGRMRPTARWRSPAPLLRRGRARDALAAIDDGRQYAGDAGREGAARRSRDAQRRSVDRPRAARRGRERARHGARRRAGGARSGARRGGVGGACALPLLARAVRRGRGGARRAGRMNMAALARAAHAAGGAHRRRLARRQPRDVAGARGWRVGVRRQDRREATPPSASRRPSSTLRSAILTRSSATSSESMAAARAAHDPLRAIRCRLLRAEADRRRGRHAAAVAQLQRLRRVDDDHAAGAAGAMGAVVGARGRRRRCRRQIVAQRVAATGLGALALYASDPRGRPGPAHGDRSVRRRARRDPARLPGGGGRGGRAEGRLRSRPAAPAGGGGRLRRACSATRADIVCGDGAAARHRASRNGRRTAGITIAPHRHDDRIEAAAPVHYGGAPIGVAVRALDARHDRRHLARRRRC